MNKEQSATILMLGTSAFPVTAEKTALERCGFEVVVANSFEEAAEAFKAKVFSLIVCDIEFDPRTGCASAIRSLLAEQEIPVLFMVHTMERHLPAELEPLATCGFVTRSSPPFVLCAAAKNAMELFNLRKKA